MLHMVPSPAGCQIVPIFSRSFLASKGKVNSGTFGGLGGDGQVPTSGVSALHQKPLVEAAGRFVVGADGVQVLPCSAPERGVLFWRWSFGHL